jgi:hypothetical protein
MSPRTLLIEYEEAGGIVGLPSTIIAIAAKKGILRCVGAPTAPNCRKYLLRSDIENLDRQRLAQLVRLSYSFYQERNFRVNRSRKGHLPAPWPRPTGTNHVTNARKIQASATAGSSPPLEPGNAGGK